VASLERGAQLIQGNYELSPLLYFRGAYRTPPLLNLRGDYCISSKP